MTAQKIVLRFFSVRFNGNYLLLIVAFEVACPEHILAQANLRHDKLLWKLRQLNQFINEARQKVRIREFGVLPHLVSFFLLFFLHLSRVTKEYTMLHDYGCFCLTVLSYFCSLKSLRLIFRKQIYYSKDFASLFSQIGLTQFIIKSSCFSPFTPIHNSILFQNFIMRNERDWKSFSFVSRKKY